MIKKYNSYLFFIIILFLIFFAIIIFFFIKNKSYIKNETFINTVEYERDKMDFNKIFSTNPSCKNPFFEKNSFCMVNNDKNKCICKFQKDEIRYSFNSPQVCCEKLCNEIPVEECLENNQFTEIPYYCNVGGVCKEYTGTIVSSKISANNCGTESLNNQLLLPFTTKAECEKNLTPCDKFNNPNNSVSKNKTDCLRSVNCGFCTNEYGQGKCIEGTASGPLDLRKYYYCNPGIKSTNTYTYGDHATYLY